MTTATFFRQDGALCGFLVSGHSGYAPSGHDIVCSAVSACTHMTALGLTEVLGLQARVTQADGRMTLMLQGECLSPAQAMLTALEKELLAITRQYPRHIRIIYRERRDFKCFS